MRILMISAEGPPLQRAGALVDVLDALPHELRERGHEVSLVLPFYRELRENKRIEAKDTGVTVTSASATKIMLPNISKVERQAESRFFLFAAMNSTIDRKFMVNREHPTTTTPRVLSFSTKPPSSWHGA